MVQTRILIVDDELVVRESLAVWLRRDGYEAGSLAGGEEAMKPHTFDYRLKSFDSFEALAYSVFYLIITSKTWAINWAPRQIPDTGLLCLSAYGRRRSIQAHSKIFKGDMLADNQFSSGFP
jgi:hypothetical protein